ncbi:MAG: DUF4397 domain-containing protein [Gemmatimonadaceae bacterium]
MRFQRLIFAAIIACAVSACAKDITGVTHTPPPLAYVRYVNAVADTFDMDFRAVDQVAYSPPYINVLFRGLGEGNYQGYQAGSRHIRIFLDPAPSSNLDAVDPAVVSTVMVDTTYTFTAGTYYTLLEVGSARANTQKLVILTDAFPAQTAGIQYRVFNLATVQGAVDIYFTADTFPPALGTPAVANVAPSTTPSAYISQATMASSVFAHMTVPGTATVVGLPHGYALQAGTAGTTDVDPIYGVTQPGSIFSIFVFDAAVAGSPAATPTNTTPAVVFYPDVQPPRTTTP